MPQLTRRFGATRPALATALLTALVSTTLWVTGPATAAPSPQDQLAQKQAEASELQSKIDANGMRISVLDEQYNATQLEIDEANDGIADTQRRLDAAASRTGQLESQLSSRAAALYVGAANGTPTEMVDATNVQELGSRAKYGSAAADEDQGLIDELTVAKEQLDGAQAEFEEQRSAAEAKKSGLEETRAELAAAQERAGSAARAEHRRDRAADGRDRRAEARAEEEARARAEFERKSRENAAKQAAAAAAAPRSNARWWWKCAQARAECTAERGARPERRRRRRGQHRDGAARQAVQVRRRRPELLRLLRPDDVRVGRGRCPAPPLVRGAVLELAARLPGPAPAG